MALKPFLSAAVLAAVLTLTTAPTWAQTELPDPNAGAPAAEAAAEFKIKLGQMDASTWELERLVAGFCEGITSSSQPYREQKLVARAAFLRDKLREMRGETYDQLRDATLLVETDDLAHRLLMAEAQMRERGECPTN